MIDSLFRPKIAHNNLWKIFVSVFLYSSLSIFVAKIILPEYVSLVSVFFISASCIYLVQSLIKKEEVFESYFSDDKVFRQHKKTILIFALIFVSVVLAFSFWSYFLPIEAGNGMFSLQADVIKNIEKDFTGSFFNNDSFSIIIKNNMGVFLVSFALSIFYGAGSFFVLVWNGSVMGYIIGSSLKNDLLINFPRYFLKYFIHGLPEMGAYFVAVLMGGIIYFFLIKGHFRDRQKLFKVSRDLIKLFFIAIFLLIFSAFVEVFISSFI